VQMDQRTYWGPLGEPPGPAWTSTPRPPPRHVAVRWNPGPVWSRIATSGPRDRRAGAGPTQGARVLIHRGYALVFWRLTVLAPPCASGETPSICSLHQVEVIPLRRLDGLCLFHVKHSAVASGRP
jgi:hypothetical protein